MNIQPLSSGQLALHRALLAPQLATAPLAVLLRFPAAVFLLGGTTWVATLEGWTFGLFVAVPLAVALVFALVEWLSLLLIVADRDEETGQRRLLWNAKHYGSLGTWLAAGSLVLGLALMYRRMPNGMWAGQAWAPIVLVVGGLLLLYLRFFPEVFGVRKVEVSAEEVDFRIFGRPVQQHAQAAGVPGQPQNEPEVMVAAKPRFNFASVHGMQSLKDRLIEAGAPVVRRSKDERTEPRNGVIFFGDPGNGKTFIAEALAGELGVKFFTLDYSKVVSEYVGRTPQNIARAFKQARAAGPCVLFIDEVDSFIVDRDSATRNTQEGSDIVNLFLTELVNIRKYPVLVLAATNRLNKLDPAAIREGRFDYKIEVTAPDEPARVGLLMDSLDRNLDPRTVERIDMEAVRSAAIRWNGFSVKRILAVGEEMPAYLKEHPTAVVGYEQLTGALRRLQGRKGKVPAETKSLEQLVLPAQTRDAISLVANRMADPMRLERLGGTLPSGILFHGPSGTGKTAAVRALAKQTGWAFLSVAGPDLLRDPDRIEKLYAEALDLRPTIVFIDEADDILRDRQYSQASALTNKLLTVMDGAGDKVKDVVWVAATNNPDQIDAAMLRAGRFTEKVPFFAADAAGASTLVGAWLAARKVPLAVGSSSARIARLLEGQSPANIEGILQYALNVAIDAAHGDDVQLSLDHVAQAMEVVAPD